MNIPFEKSFASHEKAKYWSDKNKLKPNEVFKSSHKKYWFNCHTCIHEFESQLNNVAKGQWCSYCENIKLCDNQDCKICYEKSFASHEKSNYWSYKNQLSPRYVFKGSSSKYLFNCNKCNHEFENCPSSINRGRWCIYCGNRKLCEDINCEICYNKSFASNEKSKFWSNKNKLKPREVFKSSGSKFWFNCDKCNHEFESSLNDINNDNTSCPFCSNPPKNLCSDTTCIDCYNKSFASNEKSKYWSNKNTLKPREVFKSSNYKFWFNCDCKHDFESILANIVKGQWCPYCSNPPKSLCNNEYCEHCHKNSFASHDKSKYWSNKNKIKPREVFKGSGNKFWFGCDSCNYEFESAINHVNNGKWCPLCVNKTEQILFEKLKNIYNSIIYQYRVEWCKNKTYLPYDFCIPEYKIIIELDGPQHFRQIMNWKSPEEQHSIDKFKEECANNNGYSVIRLLQEDVMNDTYDWVKVLCDAIEEIKSSNEITNIYLSKNDEYGNF